LRDEGTRLWRLRTVSQHQCQPVSEVRCWMLFSPQTTSKEGGVPDRCGESQCSGVVLAQHWRQLPILGIDAHGFAAVEAFPGAYYRLVATMELMGDRDKNSASRYYHNGTLALEAVGTACRLCQQAGHFLLSGKSPVWLFADAHDEVAPVLRSTFAFWTTVALGSLPFGHSDAGQCAEMSVVSSVDSDPYFVNTTSASSSFSVRRCGHSCCRAIEDSLSCGTADSHNTLQ
jgi:hypothetical protein